jgi:cytochrome c biogenesis protein CcdA
MGDPAVLGIATVFTPIAWIAPTIIFADYFPKDRPWYYIVGYILLFAAGAVVAQILLEQAGLWRSIRWNPLLTGLLATGTHTVITIALLTTRSRIHT